MRATCVEDLPIYQRSKAYFDAISDLTPRFKRDFWLADQLIDSAESIVSNIAEGYRQPSDRAFARYLGISAGSAEESRVHLSAAERRGHLRREICEPLRAEAKEIVAMLAGFIKYLRRCDRKNRYDR